MRYTTRQSKVWKRDDGKTASLYGACPWATDVEKHRWVLEARGWTVFDSVTNTVGLGRKPFKTEEEAMAFCKRHNK